MDFNQTIENIDIAKANIDFILLESQTNHKLVESERAELFEFLTVIYSELSNFENAIHTKALVTALLDLIKAAFWDDDKIINIFLNSGKLFEIIITESIKEKNFVENVVDIRSFEEELTMELTKEKELIAKKEAEEKMIFENNKNKEYLILELNNVKYTVNLNDIQEIIVFPESITKIPGTNEVVLGVTNQRGEVIPLIDMRLLFNTKTKEDIEYTKEDIVLTVKTSSGKMVGLIVDKVITVTKINDDHISEDVPSLEIPKEYLSGITHQSNSGNAELDESTIVLLNISNLLSEEKLSLMID
jgi:purine-binding chemotaxis protein CheW